MCLWNGPFQNLNWGLKNQISELFLWNLMVKYWSHRIKSWIYTDFRAFWTWHQLLSLAVVYRLNRGMQVWVKIEDVLTSSGSSPYLFVVHVLTCCSIFENETLCWIMIWGWMTWKRSLAFNNDDGKNCIIYLQKKK